MNYAQLNAQTQTLEHDSRIGLKQEPEQEFKQEQKRENSKANESRNEKESRMKGRKSKKGLSASSFFVFRAPVQSEDGLLDWHKEADNQDALQQKLRDWVLRKEVSEALYLASPSLHQRLHYWLEKPNSAKGQKVEQSLVKYFIRMTTRPTPFGLFASVGLGQVGEVNHLDLNQTRYRRVSRLDSLILFELKQALLKQPNIATKLPIQLNQSLYLLGQRYRYIEAFHRSNQRHYQLSSFSHSVYLEHIFHCVSRTTLSVQVESLNTAHDVAKSLCQFDKGISHEQAIGFILDLIANDILQVQLPIYLTKKNTEQAFVSALLHSQFQEQKNVAHHAQSDIHSIVHCIRTSLALLAQADEKFINDPETYRAVHLVLSNLPISVDERHAVQTDLYANHAGLQLSQSVTQGVVNDLALLSHISADYHDHLQQFKTQFIARYEHHAVPLKAVLDDESGIGFSTHKSVEAPLLKGVLLSRPESETTHPWRALDSYLFARLHDAQFEGAQEISITAADIEKHIAPVGKGQPKSIKALVPASSFVVLKLYADSASALNKGQYKASINGVVGPSMANMVGRFCHLDEKLQSQVEQELDWESKQYNGAILAEVVHLPEGRIGNITSRPALRPYEITFLADSNTEHAQQISLDDLYVYVEQQRVKLWSRSLQKEVIPRLSSAHNYHKKGLSIYRFLASLQHQGKSLPQLRLSEPLKQLPYLPRIMLGRLLLSPQQWRIPRQVLLKLSQLQGDAYRTQYQALMQKYRLSEVLLYRESDLTLTLTLNNPLLLRALLSETRHLSMIPLEEKHPDGARSPVSQSGQYMDHEIVLPLRNYDFRYQATQTAPSFFNETQQSAFLPGQEWVCYKIYTGYEAADHLLMHSLIAELETLRKSGKVQNYFFLRFGDPDWHLRLRVQLSLNSTIDTDSIANPLLNQTLCDKLIAAQSQGRVIRYEQVGYVRETQRYGGEAGMLLSEQLFTTDSFCCYQLLRKLTAQGMEHASQQNQPSENSNQVSGNVNLSAYQDRRWLVTLWGCDLLLSGLGFSPTQKRLCIERLRFAYGQEFQEQGALRQSLGKQYRKHQERVAALLSGELIPEAFICFLPIFQQRAEALQHIGQQLQHLHAQKQLNQPIEHIATSYLHMFTNRMCQHKGREQELLIYDFMLRFYKQQAAQNQPVRN